MLHIVKSQVVFLQLFCAMKSIIKALLFASIAGCVSSFSCSSIILDNIHFDLSTLPVYPSIDSLSQSDLVIFLHCLSLHLPYQSRANITQHIPGSPSSQLIQTYINLCSTAALPLPCPAASTACQVASAVTPSITLVTKIITLASSSTDPSLSLSERNTTSTAKELIIEMRGGVYQGVTQLLTLHLSCSNAATDAEIVSYDGSEMSVKWSHPAACAVAADPNQPQKDPDAPQTHQIKGTVVGFVFFLLFWGACLYFIIFAIYNCVVSGGIS